MGMHLTVAIGYYVKTENQDVFSNVTKYDENTGVPYTKKVYMGNHTTLLGRELEDEFWDEDFLVTDRGMVGRSCDLLTADSYDIPHDNSEMAISIQDIQTALEDTKSSFEKDIKEFFADDPEYANEIIDALTLQKIYYYS